MKDFVAFGDIKNGAYSIHFVNNSASRMVKLDGLPKDLKKMNILVTNKDREMDNVGTVNISNGILEFELEATSFVTLINAN